MYYRYLDPDPQFISKLDADPNLHEVNADLKH
jgi:hypothetical protein